jgi:hypothetical protein
MRVLLPMAQVCAPPEFAESVAVVVVPMMWIRGGR